MLNINSAIQLSPLDSTKPALLTVRHSAPQWVAWRMGVADGITQSESTDLKFKQIHYLQWRKCTK